VFAIPAQLRTKVVQLLQADDVSVCCPDFLQYQWQTVLPLQAADWDLQQDGKHRVSRGISEKHAAHH